MPTIQRPFLIPFILPMVAMLSGCSHSGEDVRLTLCRDMVRVTLGVEPNWQDHRIALQRHDEAVVTLNWARAGGGVGQATCHYPYNAVEDDMMNAADPLTAYSTSPTRFVLDGRNIVNPELARIIGQAMLRQGREWLDRARETLGGR